MKIINDNLKRYSARLIKSTSIDYQALLKFHLPYHWARLVYLYNKTIRVFLYTKDGSLTWLTRILILTLFGGIAIIFTPIAVEFIASWLIKNINILTDENAIFLSSVTILTFGLIVGLGYWIIRTHDVKKQFKDTFRQYNEIMLSNAINLVTQKDKSKQVIGLRELTILKNRNLIDRDRITGITASLLFDRADLAKTNLREVDLSGINLENANLQNAKLQGANLQGVNFKNANLQGANLTGAKVGILRLREYLTRQSPSTRTTYLDRTNFENANLSNAKLDHIDISHILEHGSGCNLSYTDLTRINLRHKLRNNLRNIIFQGTILEEADFEEATLTMINFNSANLVGANLRGTKLIDTYLVEADLRGADLRESLVGIFNKQNSNHSLYKLTDPRKEIVEYINTILRDAIYDNNTKFPNGFDPKKYGMRKSL